MRGAPSDELPGLTRRRSSGLRSRLPPGDLRRDSLSTTPSCRSPLPPRRSSRICPSPTSSPVADRPVSHLRRSDLAGWRTRSLIPTKDLAHDHAFMAFQSFLPVLKLRGLPYFCSRRHVLSWFGDLASHIVNLFFVAEVEPLNTGFALVTMDSPQTALCAWRVLHKKPIVGKRFVEVFALFPPHCPLSKRDKLHQENKGLIPLPAEATLLPSAAGNACGFCGASLSAHSDGGVAAVMTDRMRSCVVEGAARHLTNDPAGLMHTAFLSVPALLYQDAAAVSRSEVDSFDPELWHLRNGHVLGLEQNFHADHVISLNELERMAGLAVTRGSNPLFFDLNGISHYDTRSLLCELVQILEVGKDPLSIATLGNLLSTQARAYLFIIEAKLRNILEAYSDFFVVQRPSFMYGYFSVCLRRDVLQNGVETIQQMEAFQLTKRRRQRGSPEPLSPKPGELHRSQTSHRDPNTVTACRGGILPGLSLDDRASSHVVSRHWTAEDECRSAQNRPPLLPRRSALAADTHHYVMDHGLHGFESAEKSLTSGEHFFPESHSRPQSQQEYTPKGFRDLGDLGEGPGCRDNLMGEPILGDPLLSVPCTKNALLSPSLLGASRLTDRPGFDSPFGAHRHDGHHFDGNECGDEEEMSVALQDLIKTVSAIGEAPMPVRYLSPRMRSVTCPQHVDPSSAFQWEPMQEWPSVLKPRSDFSPGHQARVDALAGVLSPALTGDGGELGVFANDLEDDMPEEASWISEIATATSLPGDNETLMAKVVELLQNFTPCD